MSRTNQTFSFQLHWNDYLNKTSHLDMLHHGVYFRLMLEYYRRGAALPHDEKTICRMTGACSSDEQNALHSVLSEFFEKQPDGSWRHDRIEEELRVIAEKRSAAAKSAQMRWDKERNANADATAYTNADATAYTNADADAMLTEQNRTEPGSDSKQQQKPQPSSENDNDVRATKKLKEQSNPKGGEALSPKPETAEPKGRRRPVLTPEEFRCERFVSEVTSDREKVASSVAAFAAELANRKNNTKDDGARQ